MDASSERRTVSRLQASFWRWLLTILTILKTRSGTRAWPSVRVVTNGQRVVFNAAHEREDFLSLLDRFLVANFHLPVQTADRGEGDYPALPLLLSPVDTAIDRGQPMGPSWSVESLRQVRRALQYVIFALLEHKLRRLKHNFYDLFTALDPNRSAPPAVISLNYDIIVDNAFVAHYGYLPEYGRDITTGFWVQRPDASQNPHNTQNSVPASLATLTVDD